MIRLADADYREQQRIKDVWNKGIIKTGFDPDAWREDVLGNLIRFASHGNRGSQFGWEIDHIVPVASGGSDDLSNLRPLQWEANVKRN